MFNEPYETSFCKHAYNIAKLRSELQRADLQHGSLISPYNLFDTDSRQFPQWALPSYGLRVVGPAATRITTFQHPIVFKGQSGHNVIASDYRPWIREPSPNEYTIVQRNELFFELLKSSVSEVWSVRKDYSLFSNISAYPRLVFQQVIGNLFRDRFNLDMAEARDIRTIAGFYFLSLMDEDFEMSPQRIALMCSLMGEDLGESSENIVSIGDRLIISTDHPFNTIDGFAEMITKVTGNIRLEGLNRGVIYSMIANLWYGSRFNEYMTVAMEYPPYFMLLVYEATNDKSHKRTKIGMTVNSLPRQMIDKDWVQQFQQVINTAHQ